MWLRAEVRTLADVTRYRATVTPDPVALVEGGRSLTYRELDARSDRVAAAIATEGIEAGSHVGMLAKNCLEFFELWFGAVKAGCALAPFSWRLAEPELVELIDDARTHGAASAGMLGVLLDDVVGRPRSPRDPTAAGPSQPSCPSTSSRPFPPTARCSSPRAGCWPRGRMSAARAARSGTPRARCSPWRPSRRSTSRACPSSTGPAEHGCARP